MLGQVSFEEREVLCAADPETFHFTPHYQNYPYVLARLKRLKADELRGYLERQWRHNAPKKWLRAWDMEAGVDGTRAKTSTGMTPARKPAAKKAAVKKTTKRKSGSRTKR